MSENICPHCHQPLPDDAPAGLCPSCVLAAALESAPAVQGPSLADLRAAFSQLEILGFIGRGAMGLVYKARQPNLDRMVALKILAPDLSHDPGFAERFTREARALAKLNHPNIVGIHDFGECGGFFYLLMEYVDGVNLRQAMSASRFTPEQALAIVPKLCSAIQFAHDHGILHRDIKPENILLDTTGRVKVADFGIVRLLDDTPDRLTLTATGSSLGSAAYMAPEQIEDPRNVDHRADIYSLGVIFYEMLTGGLPLGRFPVPSETAGTDPGLDEVVLRALQKQRERRYQRADEIETDLDHPPAAKPAPKLKPRPTDDEPAGRIRLGSLGLLFGGLVTGTIGWFTSPVLVGLGATAFVFGEIGCWWMLVRMKQGLMEPPVRDLILTATLVPALMAIGLLGLQVPLEALTAFADPDLDRSGGWEALFHQHFRPSLVWILVPLVMAMAGCHLLGSLARLPAPARRRNGASAARLAALGLAVAAALAAGDLARDLLGRFPRYYSLVHQVEVGRIDQKFGDARPPDAPGRLAEQDTERLAAALRRAVGPHPERFHVRYSSAVRGNVERYEGAPDRPGFAIGFLAQDPDLAERQLAALDQRVRASLPAALEVSASDEFRPSHGEIRELRRSWGFRIRVMLVVPFLSACLLATWAGRTGIAFAAITGGVLIAAAGRIDLAGPIVARMDPPPVAPRHELAALPELPDFSTPMASLTTITRAAREGDLRTFAAGFSREHPEGRDPDRLAEFMPAFARCTLSSISISGSRAPAPALATALLDFPTGGRYSLPLFHHLGEWKIDTRDDSHRAFDGKTLMESAKGPDVESR